MGDRLSYFLLANYDASVIERRPSVASIAALSAAVVEINGLFIESKVALRIGLVSIYAATQSVPSGINQVFDGYCGTLGVPLERRLEEVADMDEYPNLKNYLNTLASSAYNGFVALTIHFLSLSPSCPASRYLISTNTPNRP